MRGAHLDQKVLRRRNKDNTYHLRNRTEGCSPWACGAAKRVAHALHTNWQGTQSPTELWWWRYKGGRKAHWAPNVGRRRHATKRRIRQGYGTIFFVAGESDADTEMPQEQLQKFAQSLCIFGFAYLSCPTTQLQRLPTGRADSLDSINTSIRAIPRCAKTACR